MSHLKIKGKVSDIVSRLRLDVRIAGDTLPEKFNILKVLDFQDREVGTVTVWRSNKDGTVWTGQGDDWIRCKGETKNFRPGFTVFDTGKKDPKSIRLDKGLKLRTHILRKLGYPKTNVKETAVWRPPQTDPKLKAVLNDILDAVTHNLGYRVAMLATNENNGLTVQVVRSKDEWLWEWANELVEVETVGTTLLIDDFPDNIAVVTSRKAVREEPEPYSVIRNVRKLWDFIYVPEDTLMLLGLQFLSGVFSIITIPFCAKNEAGKVELIGNMYVGSTKIRHSKRDIAVLRAFVEQASLAIQNTRLIKHIENRAIQAETLAQLADFGSKMTHRMINEVGFARVQTKSLIETEFHKLEAKEFNRTLDLIDDSLETALSHIKEMKEPFKILEKKPVSIIESINRALYSVKCPPNIEIKYPQNDLPFVEADDNLSEVFRVLINNSIEAISGKGQVLVEGQISEDGLVKVLVSDTGSGISEEHMGKIFDLFFTTKQSVNSTGNGLGLWWVRTYIMRLGGRVEIEKTSTEGTIISLSLRISV